MVQELLQSCGPFERYGLGARKGESVLWAEPTTDTRIPGVHRDTDPVGPARLGAEPPLSCGLFERYGLGPCGAEMRWCRFGHDTVGAVVGDPSQDRDLVFGEGGALCHGPGHTAVVATAGCAAPPGGR